MFAVGVDVLVDGQAPGAPAFLSACLFLADEGADGFLEAVGFEAELFVIIACRGWRRSAGPGRGGWRVPSRRP